MKFISGLYWILERKWYLKKMNNLPKHHGAGPNAAASVYGRPCRPAYYDYTWKEMCSANCTKTELGTSRVQRKRQKYTGNIFCEETGTYEQTTYSIKSFTMVAAVEFNHACKWAAGKHIHDKTSWALLRIVVVATKHDVRLIRRRTAHSVLVKKTRLSTIIGRPLYQKAVFVFTEQNLRQAKFAIDTNTLRVKIFAWHKI